MKRALEITYHNPSIYQVLQVKSKEIKWSWSPSKLVAELRQTRSTDHPGFLLEIILMHNFANLIWKVFLFLILACRESPQEAHTKLVFLQRAQKLKRSNQMTLMAEIVHFYPED